MMKATETKGTILIVDDIPANLQVLAQLLIDNGYRVRPAPNGLHALISIRSTLPDLILLDIVMPDMDGYEVCAQLKADDRTRAIPIIFISALEEPFDKVRAFSVGGVDYITKPFEEEEILARIETHLTILRLQQELQLKNRALQQSNDILEEQVEARTIALKTEIEQRKSHQQEKDRLFELAQQQSEQLRSMTNLLIEAQQNQRQGLSTGLDTEIQQKINLSRSNLALLQNLMTPEVDPQISTLITHTTHLLAQMESYINQVTAELDQATVADRNMSDNPLLQLSARERDVLQLMVEGKSTTEISEILTVTINTVHTYLKRIRRKLDIQDVPGLVKFAQESGLLE
jgi:CheY-like chemotaxis protein/DNA-binding CsgD family transcriptional regulator